jgi:hypothetical protein
MIKMWDNQFSLLNPKIPKFWRNLENAVKEEILGKILEIMHNSIGKTWC